LKTKEGKVFLDVESDFAFEIIPEFSNNLFNLKFSKFGLLKGRANLDEYNLYQEGLFHNWVTTIFNVKVGDSKVFTSPFDFRYYLDEMRILENQGLILKGNSLNL